MRMKERRHHYIHHENTPMPSPHLHPAFRDLTKPPTPRCLLPHSWPDTHTLEKIFYQKQLERSPGTHPLTSPLCRNTRNVPTHHIIIVRDEGVGEQPSQPGSSRPPKRIEKPNLTERLHIQLGQSWRPTTEWPEGSKVATMSYTSVTTQPQNPGM